MNATPLVCWPWDRVGPGRHGRLALPLVAAGLMVQLGGAVADPWGISVGGDQPSGRGPWDQQAQGPGPTDGYPSALHGVEAPATAEVPAPAQPDWRFRGDPPKPGGMAVGGMDAGPYRFRPLTGRELERQGAGVDGRPGFGFGPWGPSP